MSVTVKTILTAIMQQVDSNPKTGNGDNVYGNGFIAKLLPCNEQKDRGGNHGR